MSNKIKKPKGNPFSVTMDESSKKPMMPGGHMMPGMPTMPPKKPMAPRMPVKKPKTPKMPVKKSKAGKKKNWIAGAIKHPGAETAAAHRAGMSTQAYMQQHAHDSGTAGRRARLGLTLTRISRRGRAKGKKGRK